MKVRDLMEVHPVSVSARTPILEVWKIIHQKHVHGIPVIDSNKKLLGIISQEDLLSKLYPEEAEAINDLLEVEYTDIEEKMRKLRFLTAEKIMSKRVFFTRAETEVMRALSRMIIRKVRQLPVIDEESKLLGMISKGDIFNSIFNKNIKSFLRRVTPTKNNPTSIVQIRYN